MRKKNSSKKPMNIRQPSSPKHPERLEAHSDGGNTFVIRAESSRNGVYGGFMYITHAQAHALADALYAGGFRNVLTTSTRYYFGCCIEQVGNEWIVEKRTIYPTLREAKAAIRKFHYAGK